MFKCTIAYDGTHYFGWQKTKSGPSIQEELQKAIVQITGEMVLPEAASRTDRGVHARGQVIQFVLRKGAESEKLLRGLNGVLPQDIRILEIESRQFHPTLDAMGKEYHYQVCLHPVQDPTLRLYSWHIRRPLDRTKMERGAIDLVGTHDFTSFANKKEANPVCTIESITFHGDHFQIKGDRFLYKMVRNIVGTLVHIGCGKVPVDSISSTLQSKSREQAGITAPAHGLHLHQVFYPIK